MKYEKSKNHDIMPDGISELLLMPQKGYTSGT